MPTKDSTKEIITSYLSPALLQIFSAVPAQRFEEIREIRIRVGKPLLAMLNGAECFFPSVNPYRPTHADVAKILELVSDFSLYAFEEELRNGYITIPGGHRVGLTGRAVAENGAVKTIKNVNGINFRLSHQILGCADSVMPYLSEKSHLRHTMILSPPCCGKTTLLRDVVRQISLLNGQAVGLVDERSEIAGCFRGEPQNDVGPRTDVLDACPKAEGMLILLRAMSPTVIAADEIGKDADIAAIDSVMNAGIKLICTAHGASLAELNNRPGLDALLKKRVFERFVILSRPGIVEGVYDSVGKKVDG